MGGFTLKLAIAQEWSRCVNDQASAHRLEQPTRGRKRQGAKATIFDRRDE